MTDSTAKRRGRPPRTAPIQAELPVAAPEVSAPVEVAGVNRPAMRPAMR